MILTDGDGPDNDDWDDDNDGLSTYTIQMMVTVYQLTSTQPTHMQHHYLIGDGGSIDEAATVKITAQT